MAIKINIKRISLLGCIAIFCLCTAMRCKKADWMYEDIDRLEDAKVFVTLSPDKNIYNVGDTVFITGKFLPKDLNMKDFSLIESSIWVNSFKFCINDSLKFGDRYYEKLHNDTTLNNSQFSSDRLSFSFKQAYILNLPGRYRIDYGVEPPFKAIDSQGNKIYSTLYISILSGKRRPRGYNTDAIMYFTNNKKTYIEIEVQ
ncbi:hypothetical protein J5U18_13615 [Sphingobacteriaceae bacterium WQ 2009]|uniref:Uncharacterized protein n=1 Tax=Rhinopithecimicrobium faecis TaxID=2820698 RepID=A0A8T4HIW0_9SPHI|nr:hypothetical protein [Sphingobacteriaceae bacterium WQ 2009]